MLQFFRTPSRCDNLEMGIGQLGELNDNPEECVCVFIASSIYTV